MILKKAKKLGKQIILPVDTIVADSFSKDSLYNTMCIDN